MTEEKQKHRVYLERVTTEVLDLIIEVDEKSEAEKIGRILLDEADLTRHWDWSDSDKYVVSVSAVKSSEDEVDALIVPQDWIETAKESLR